MSASMTGLWGLLSKPKSEEKRRPKKPEDPEWYMAKGLSVLMFASSLYITSDWAVRSLSAPKPLTVARLLLSGWVTQRSIKNLRDTFKAAKESGNYKHKQLYGIAQASPPTTTNLSVRNSFNTGIGFNAVVVSSLDPSSVFIGCSGVALGLYFRSALTQPEGDQGHFRPKWLRDVMKGGGDKGGPSGP
jgi:hypothetical protein